MKRQLAVLSAVVVATAFVQAEIIFDENLDAFDVKIETGNPPLFDNVVIPEASGPFASGNALHTYDYDPDEKPELRGELSAPLTSPYILSFDSYIPGSPSNTSKSIRFRMSNSGVSPTSESRAAFSLSWDGDGDFTAKYSDGGNGTSTLTASVGNDKVFNVTMVGNANDIGGADYSYSLFGETRTVNPQHYDIFVDGALLNDDTGAEELNGLEFTLGKASGNYDTSLGLGQFGLFGSSDADTGSNAMFDNIEVTVVPEPASLGLMGIASVAFLFMRRRMRR